MAKEKETVTLPEGMTPEDVRKALDNYAQQPPKPTPEGGEVVFAEFDIGRDIIRVYRDVYKGREVLSARRFYQDDSGARLPGKGLSFKYEHIDELIEGLQKMKEWCEENPGKE